MSKKKDKVMRVTFCGTNATEVTGSKTLLTVANNQYLLECGLHQSSKSVWEEYKINSAKFDFKAKNINSVFVGHSHSDHCNLLPLLGCVDTKIMCRFLSRISAQTRRGKRRWAVAQQVFSTQYA